MSRLRRTVRRVRAWVSSAHVYLSTGCLHGEHGYCQATVGAVGRKVPATCKFCGTPCVCDCHAATAPKRRDRGASAVEYALMIAAVAAVIVGAVFVLGRVAVSAFSHTCSAVASGAALDVTAPGCDGTTTPPAGTGGDGTPPPDPGVGVQPGPVPVGT